MTAGTATQRRKAWRRAGSGARARATSENGTSGCVNAEGKPDEVAGYEVTRSRSFETPKPRNPETLNLLLPLHELLHLIISNRSLRRDDHRRGPLAERRDRAADDGRAVGCRLAAEDAAGGLYGRDHLPLDRGGGDRRLRQAFLRGDAQFDRRAGDEVDLVHQRELEVLALRLRREVVDDHLVKRPLLGHRGRSFGQRRRDRRLRNLAGGRSGGGSRVGRAVETAALDRRDHGAVLLLHEAADPLLVGPAPLELVGVGGLLRGEDLAANVHQRLDIRVLQPLILGLDVVDLLVVSDVGVEPGDHAPVPFWKARV